MTNEPKGFLRKIVMNIFITIWNCNHHSLECSSQFGMCCVCVYLYIVYLVYVLHV